MCATAGCTSHVISGQGWAPSAAMQMGRARATRAQHAAKQRQGVAAKVRQGSSSSNSKKRMTGMGQSLWKLDAVGPGGGVSAAAE